MMPGPPAADIRGPEEVRNASEDIMTADPVTVGPGQTIADVIRRMVEHRVSGVPVVGPDRKLLGIVTEGDLLRQGEATAAAHPDKRIEVWFLDAARVGQKGRTGYRWWLRGERPRGLCDRRFNRTCLTPRSVRPPATASCSFCPRSSPKR